MQLGSLLTSCETRDTASCANMATFEKNDTAYRDNLDMPIASSGNMATFEKRHALSCENMATYENEG
eukprot:2930642-Prorocentrum_lima.AAC.1